MRLMIVVGIAGLCLGPFAALAQEKLPAAASPPPRTLSSQIESMLPAKVAGASGDRLVFASAAAVFGAIALNFMSGGMIAALVGIGGSSVPATSVATFAATEMTWHGTVWGVGPAAILSVGQPVDAALRDGYTTPQTLAGAFAESGRRAEALAAKAGTYVSTTVGGWWNRL
jgi:hypothetical protein